MSGPHHEDETFGMTDLHHVLPTASDVAQGRVEVMATILAHSDRGDGYCAACLERADCGTKRYHETVLHDLNRRYGKG